MIVQRVAPPYYQVISTPRKFIGLISQDSTNAPVLSVIKNEIGDLEVGRSGVGTYEILWDGFGDTINTIILQNNAIDYAIAAFDTNTGRFNILTYTTAAGTLTDGVLDGAYIEMTAYQVIS